MEQNRRWKNNMYKNRGGQTLSDKQEKDIMEQEEQKEIKVKPL